MYRAADETINRGLSLGARILLGTVAALFGVIMVLFATTSEKPFGAYLFGALCFVVALACFTYGRVRQFLGSIIGSAMFVAGVFYLADEIFDGKLLSGSRAEPSVLNAILYLALIGLPGGAYVLKARFGFAKKQ
jgi:drug/metabolite transporter (DMT)-like permease